MILPSKIQHVYPVNDTKGHKTFCNFREKGLPYCPCPCQPNHQELNPDENGEPTAMIIVHNSFDGREGVEWANELLKNMTKS